MRQLAIKTILPGSLAILISSTSPALSEKTLAIASIDPSQVIQPVARNWRDYVRTASQNVSPYVPPELIFAVIRAESAGNAKAVSPKGAQGLMQLMPDTARRFGVKDSFDSEQNIKGGVTYLAELLSMFNMDPVRAVAAYNAGENRIYRYDGVPPFEETMAYTLKVMREFIETASPSDPLFLSLDMEELLRVARRVGGDAMVDRLTLKLIARQEISNSTHLSFNERSSQTSIAAAQREALAAQQAAQQQAAAEIAALQAAERTRIANASASSADGRWDLMIHNEALSAQVPIPIIKAIITAGSGWDMEATNHYGARGLMQLRPATAEYYGSSGLPDPESNIRAGINYLAALRAHVGEDNYTVALAFRTSQRGQDIFDPNDEAFARRVVELYGEFYRKTAMKGGYLRTGIN